jgi:hypothetical protein
VDDAATPGRLEDGLGVGRIRRQRLLAQHVLAGCDQRLDGLAVLVVGQRDAHHVDLAHLGHLLPRGSHAVDLPAQLGVLRQVRVGIGDHHQVDAGWRGLESAAQGAEGAGVGAADHAGADDGHPESRQAVEHGSGSPFVQAHPA